MAKEQICVSLEKETIKKINNLAKKEYRTRSKTIELIVEKAIERKNRLKNVTG